MGLYLNLLAVIAPRMAARKGFALFCYPFRIPMKTYHKAFLDSAEKYTFDHNGTSIQVYKWGNGKRNILFLHGWQSHSFRWKNYIEALPKDEFTVYALDAPGHGFSDGNFLTVPFYSEVIEKFIRSVNEIDTVVGHSLGAFTTLYTFHRLPLLPVQKLVFMGTPGEAMEFIEFYKQTLRLSDRCIALILDHFKDVIEHPIEFFSISNFASSLNRPGLLIHDEEDAEALSKHSKKIHELWPKSRLILTRGLGHNLRSASVVNHVTSFVTGKSVELDTRAV